MASLHRVEKRDRVVTDLGQPCREHGQDTDRCDMRSTAIEGRRATTPEGSTPLGGFAREIAAWLGYVDPKHEVGKLSQRITNWRATEAWTDGRHAEHDKYVEMADELAVALANACDGRCSEVHKHWLSVMCPSHRKTQPKRCNPHLRNLQDARTQELKETHSKVIESGRASINPNRL